MSNALRAAIAAHYAYGDIVYGEIYAHEVDGYGSVDSMAEANSSTLQIQSTSDTSQESLGKSLVLHAQSCVDCRGWAASWVRTSVQETEEESEPADEKNDDDEEDEVGAQTFTVVRGFGRYEQVRSNYGSG